MAPLTKSAIWSLLGLTVHFSILSITLHVSRSSAEVKYKASSAVVLTELLKIIICILLTIITQETKPARDPLEWLQSTHSTTSTTPNSSNKKSNHSNLTVDIHLADQHHQSYPTLSLQPPTPNSPLKSPGLVIDHAILHPYTFLPSSALTDSPESCNTFSLTAMLEPIFDELLNPRYWNNLKKLIFGKGWWKLAIPSSLFVYQANAQYIASENLSVPLFQLAYQLKIPATALCSVLLLKRSLSSQQWFSLFILTLGVGIVQLNIAAPPSLPSQFTPIPPSGLFNRSISNFDSTIQVHKEVFKPNQFLGLTAVITACISSGFASTYFEKMLKKSPATPNNPSVGLKAEVVPSIWIRNIQLSLFGLAVGIPLAFFEIGKNWKAVGGEELLGGSGFSGVGILELVGGVEKVFEAFFEGFNGLTWAVILLQVSGGLLGALVMQHADNITKCFSTSISILLSFAASMYLFNFRLSIGVACGSSFVLLATYFYATSSTKRRPIGSS